MSSFLRRLFGKAPLAQLPAPSEVEALLEANQKTARAQARIALQCEEIEHKLEAGFDDLRRQLRDEIATLPKSADALKWDELLDAMDLLEQALVVLAEVAPESARGLQGVKQRLERFLGQANLVRAGEPGNAADGRLFRVVGSEEHAALTPGLIARVVRAAVLRGGDVVREGEVITTRRAM